MDSSHQDENENEALAAPSKPQAVINAEPGSENQTTEYHMENSGLQSADNEAEAMVESSNNAQESDVDTQEGENHEGYMIDDPVLINGIELDIEISNEPDMDPVNELHDATCPSDGEGYHGNEAAQRLEPHDSECQAQKQTAQRSPSPEELVVMEDIFEPRPSTSRDSGLNRIGGSPNVSVQMIPESEPVVAFEAPKKRVDSGERKQSLKFLPRSSQYEKHPLLQIRSDSGLSEFDLMMMERDTSSSHPRTCSLEEPLSGDHKVTVLKRRLVPRSAHYERNLLFEKNESGLSQLEQYLMEKEQEVAETSSTSHDTSLHGGPHSIATTESGIGTLSESSNVSASSNASPVPTKDVRAKDDIALVPALLEVQSAEAKRRALVHSKSVPESYNPPTMNLVPRQDQYQAHHLLQHKDDKGMSELQNFLHEMEIEYTEKGKCSTKCTCKNINCSKCKVSSPRTVTKEVDMLTRIEPKSNNKRVHFQRQDCVEQTTEAKENDKDSTNQATAESGNNGVEESGTGESPPEDQSVPAADSDDAKNALEGKVNHKVKTSKKGQNSKCILS